MQRLSAALLAIGLAACSPSGDPGSGPGGEADAGSNASTGPAAPADLPTYDARIRWTSYGIPHVDAGDWGSLGYGFAYATANDAVCVIARDVITVNGELARHFGDTADNLASDVFHRAVLGTERTGGFATGQSERAAAFSRGYVAGYNRFLRDQGDDLPAACAGADWVRPLTAEDLTRLTIGVGIRYGLGRFREEMAAAQPPGAVAGGTAAPDPSGAGAAALAATLHTDFAAPAGFGSNAVAVGRAASASGRGLLLGNPHYPWHGPSRFHLIHTTIPGEVDVMGVSLLNTTRIGIGFNQDVAWSHTVSTALRSTLYRLTLDPENPLRYRYGDGWRELQPVTVRVPLAPDSGAYERTVYFSHYGPVVSSAELPWNATTAYAVRDANLANDRSAATYDALARARNIDEVEAAISRQGVSWTNTIAADRHGTAFYADISVTPNVDAALLERCDARPDTVPGAVVVLDGADPDCEWREDERSAIPGVLPAEEMPRLKRDDYVANSNDSYWLSNPQAPLEGFSPIIGAERTARSLRTRAGLAFIREQLDADGDISADELQAMLYSHRNFGAELLLDDVLELCEPASATTLDGTTMDIGAACRILAAWDRRMTNTSRGGQIWREFMRIARTVEDPFAVPFDPAQPVTTPRGIAIDDERVRGALRTALATAVARLDRYGIPMDAPLAEIQYAQRHDERIPIPGGEGWAGMWSMIVTEPDAETGYPPIAHGNSYIQVISWDEAGKLDPRAVLTYSQSPEPESPHYADMTRLYSEGKWVRLPFAEEEIAGDPNLVTLRLQE